MIIPSHILNLKNLIKDRLIQKVAKNSGIILSGNSISSGLNIISFALMARQLGPEILAILILAQTYALIINDLFNVQTWESVIKFGSADKDNIKISSIIKTNILLDIISAIVAFIIAFTIVRYVIAFLDWDENISNLLSIYSISILFNITTFTIGIPRFFDKFLSIAKINVTVAVLKLISIIIVVKLNGDFIWYFSIYLATDILIKIILMILSMNVLKNNLRPDWWKTKLSLNMDQIKFIWWTNLRTIIRIPVQRLDVVIISSVMSIKMVGIYKVYKEIAGLLSRFVDPISQSIYPEFSKLLGDKNIKKTANIAYKTIFLLSIVSIVLISVLLFSSKLIITEFFGSEYLIKIYALYFMITLFGLKIITAPINSLFIASGFARYSFIVVLVTNTIYLIMAYLCGKAYGIYGIVLAFATQWALNKGLKILVLARYWNEWGQKIR